MTSKILHHLLVAFVYDHCRFQVVVFQMSIAAQLKQFKLKALEGLKETKEYSNENPMERAKREIQQSIASSEKYRASVLKNVSTFGMYLYYSFI